MKYPNLKRIKIHNDALITRHYGSDKIVSLEDLIDDSYLASLEGEFYVFWFNEIKYSVNKDFVDLL